MSPDTTSVTQPSESPMRGSPTPPINYGADVDVMLAYCRENGIPIPAADVQSVQNHFSVASADRSRPNMTLHGSLSLLVRPATPRTLAATAFSRRPFRIGSALALVFGLSAVGLVAVVLYAVTLAGASGEGRVLSQLNCLSAALLGASFNALFIASPYIRDRTFDPRYIPVYTVRLVLGLIAGFILANIGKELLTGDTMLAKLGTGMIGLLGGYSAEAVRAVLDRLVEVMLAAVKGGAGTGTRPNVTSDLLDISQDAAADPNTPEPVRRKLEQLLKKLQK